MYVRTGIRNGEAVGMVETPLGRSILIHLGRRALSYICLAAKRNNKWLSEGLFMVEGCQMQVTQCPPCA